MLLLALLGVIAVFYVGLPAASTALGMAPWVLSVVVFAQIVIASVVLGWLLGRDR